MRSPRSSRSLAAWTVAALVLLVALTVGPGAARAAEDGLVRLKSPYSVDETIARLKTAVEAKGVTVFADIPHTANAAALDLEMPPSHLLIFGSPRIGAPLMTAAPPIGIDLPIKALAWQDADGQVWLGYNDPAYLADRHGLDPSLPPFQGMAKALIGFTAHAVATE
ncbi:DUF302 domain-containing protein [Roseospira marina]|uniref:DUF302 domain-containing protein n=1 Tax=Roseospira marina TaxID=140057 RepID=A0A5M6IC93_9PROT|nr:DUF302 domain-containing protein [Roseospira marina]KAA5605587.1 DUF302 domain-containing protein [Roseospira marina]MBB4313348.1 uncharacterized protein (DUF302 family) [Roseospira marina]MBB5085911.1 uncharacterized protein (DUF302 family) [Roseospira marina]